MATLDVSEAEEFDGNFDPIAEEVNRVTAFLFDVEETTSQSGNEMLDITWRVTEPEKFEDRRIFDNWMLEGKGAGITQMRLELLAPELLDDLEDDEVDFDPNELQGKKADLQISVSDYNPDNPSDQVDSVYLPEEEEEESWVPPE